MGREILLKGDIINGKFLYEIEDVSGTGASCIVYKARYYDDKKQSHLVQIKEFYPYNLEICRGKNSNNLICTDIEQFEPEMCRFISNAKKLASFNNDEATNSGTPFQVEIFETNQTAYSVVAYDAGDIYNEEDLQTMELTKVLEIIKNLARAVEFLHKNGYVHLDIKPENFLIDNTERVTLFDVDSIVLCDDINSENAHNISYTKKWAAPEVKYAAEKSDYKDISCKSDIFSIGVILFEAIMGRDFLPMETVSYNRNWDVENSIKAREEKQNRKVNINPKFYHKIKEIFEKTLDRNPSKRYNSAQELYDNLDKVRDLLKENPWIIPTFRTVTPQFTGRKNELAKMNGILQKENTVFLHGFGGIGKSELALKYAEVYKDDFDTVVFCKYQESIKNALLNIEIANEDKTTLHRIKELCDERTLIILDNFDVETDADDYLDDFINNYHCKKIITTRTDFSKLYKQLDVDALEQDDAILLFEKESKWVPKTEDEEKTLDEILKLIGFHTYFTVILAKKKEMFSLSIYELKKQTEEMLIKKSGKVTVAKDGKLTTDTVNAIAKKLFDFNSITESQKQTLRNLYMLSWRTISRNDYTEIAGYGMSDEGKIELIDSLNDLTRHGWVLYTEKTDDFFLHPIMQEIVKETCKENDYFPKNIVDYYQEKIAYIENDKALGYEEQGYILSLLARGMVFLADLLITLSYSNIEIVVDFIVQLDKIADYAYEIKEQLKNNTALHKTVSKVNDYCLTGSSLEVCLKWTEFVRSEARTATGGIIKSEECDYLKLCLILHDKLGVSQSSPLDIKEQWWSLAREYPLYIKADLYEQGIADKFLTEDDIKLIDYVDEIQDILFEEELNLFNEVFKEWESYIADLDDEDDYIEFENDNYQKYLQKINTLQCVTKEIYTDINSDKDLTHAEKCELIYLLIINAIKHTSLKIVYNDISINTEFTKDEKNELLHEVFVANYESLEKDLEDHVEDKFDEYGDILILYSERELDRLDELGYEATFERSRFLGVALLGKYIRNKEQFTANLEVSFEKLYIKYLKNDKYKLTITCWKYASEAFSEIKKLHEIFPFINGYINRILDKNTHVDTFSFLQLMEDLSKKVYEETKDGDYLEMQKQYKKRMNEMSGVNYNIKD